MCNCAAVVRCIGGEAAWRSGAPPRQAWESKRRVLLVALHHESKRRCREGWALVAVAIPFIVPEG